MFRRGVWKPGSGIRLDDCNSIRFAAKPHPHVFGVDCDLCVGMPFKVLLHGMDDTVVFAVDTERVGEVSGANLVIEDCERHSFGNRAFCVEE
jgi:hypothetical protein